MAKEAKTTKKLPNYKVKPLTGDMGNTFSKDNQPDPELKKKGWKELREKRLLTQEIIKRMIGPNGTPTDTFKEYIDSLIINAKFGNAKAIDAINKGLEDDIQKIETTVTQRTTIIDWSDNNDKADTETTGGSSNSGK